MQKNMKHLQTREYINTIKYFEMAWYWLQMHGPTVQRSSLEAHHSVEKILTADQFAMVLCGCHTHSKTLGWIWYDLIGSCKGFLLTRQLGWNKQANSGMPPAQRWSFKHQWCDLMQTKISQVILPYLMHLIHLITLFLSDFSGSSRWSISAVCWHFLSSSSEIQSIAPRNGP